MEANIATHGRNFDLTAFHCLENEPTVLSTIQLCAQDDSVVSPLMHIVALKTESLVPKHTYVPWIVVDGVHDADVENKIIADMYGYFKGKQQLKYLK